MTKKMEIKNIPIKDLKFAKYNPRQANEKEFNDLRDSIKRFGFVEPIIVNSAPGRKNVIIGGHFRIRVAKEMGIKEVPVHYVKISNIKKEKELNLRLNKNLGSWDFNLLANFDESMLGDVGFDSEEMDRIFGLDIDEDEFDADKEYQKISKSKSKNGEVYQLGKHRLMCGDATKEKEVRVLMGGGPGKYGFYGSAL